MCASIDAGQLDAANAGRPLPFPERESSVSVPTSIVVGGDVALVDRVRGAVLLEASSPQGDDFKGDQNPQDNNMGVIDTKLEDLPSFKQARTSLDWLTVTFPKDLVNLAHKSPYTLVDLLGLPVDHIIDEGHGESGYTALYTLDVPGARLRVGGNAGTASLQLSGGALKHFEKKGLDVWGALVYFDDLGATATRLDWAFDDYTGTLDFEVLAQGIRDGGQSELVTVYRSKPQLQGTKTFGGDDWTIYFGSKNSSTRVRIYNKKAEQEAKGEIVTRPHWIRTELQLRKEQAEKAFRSWVNLGFVPKYALGILRGRIDFRIPSEDENKSRWEVVGWWLSFVGAAEELKVTLEAKHRDFEAMKRWLENQVAKSLALLEDVCGADAVGALVGNGRGRYDKRDEAFRDAALVEQTHGPPTDRPPGHTSAGTLYATNLLSEQLERREILEDVAWAMGAF
jgi:DNA relaxase NicK